MLVMALDIATQCGVAVGDSSDWPESFSVLLKRRGQGPELAARGILAFLRNHFLDREKPDLVCIEQYMNPAVQRSSDAVVLQLMCFGAAVAFCGLAGVRVETAAPATVRKHFCGRANAGDRASTKRMVLDRAKMLSYLPIDCEDDNRADACAIWDFACAKYARCVPNEIVLFGEKQ